MLIWNGELIVGSGRQATGCANTINTCIATMYTYNTWVPDSMKEWVRSTRRRGCGRQRIEDSDNTTLKVCHRLTGLCPGSGSE